MNPYYNPLSGLGQSLKKTWQTVSGAFGSAAKVVGQTPEAQAVSAWAMANQPASTGMQFLGNRPVAPQYYQVKKEDKSVADVAAKTGMSVSDVVAANYGAQSLPPKGSWISLSPADIVRMTGGGGGGVNPPATSPQRGGQEVHNLTVQAQAISQQLSSGQMPNIPSAVVGFIRNASGEPLTIPLALQMGYRMDANGILIAPGGTPTAGGGGGWVQNQDADFLDQLRLDPDRGKYIKIGQLIKEGKLDLQGGWHRRGKPKRKRVTARARQYNAALLASQTQTVAESQREGASTVIDIHLGSG